MTRPIRDLAASIRQRLANLAKERRRPAAELLQYFAMERLLYRLAQSPHRHDFVLKGAMLLVAWRAPQARPTMDIDLLSRAADGARAVESAVRDLCRMRVALVSFCVRLQSVQCRFFVCESVLCRVVSC